MLECMYKPCAVWYILVLFGHIYRSIHVILDLKTSCNMHDLWNDNETSNIHVFVLQDDILINLVIEQMINDTDPGMIILILFLSLSFVIFRVDCQNQVLPFFFPLVIPNSGSEPSISPWNNGQIFWSLTAIVTHLCHWVRKM